MCWGQSPWQRTIATSRSEATTTEPKPENETTARTQGSRGSLALLAQSKGNVRLALLLRSHAEEDRFRLTSSFRNGPLRTTNPRSRFPSSQACQIAHRLILLWSNPPASPWSRHDGPPRPASHPRPPRR